MIWKRYGISVAITIAVVIGLTAAAVTFNKHGANAGDWLQFIGGALGAALAVAGAAVTDIQRQARARAADQASALREVVRAVDDALAVAADLKEFIARGIKDAERAQIAARACQCEATLDRLLNRPVLTDGAISIGAGAMQMMRYIINNKSAYNPHIFGGDGPADLLAALGVLETQVLERRTKVDLYARRLDVRRSRLWIKTR